MKKLLIIFIALMLSLSVVACDSVDDEQERQTEQLMTEAQKQIGMPNIKNFAERKMLKEVLEKADDPNLITYLYTTNLEGKLVYQGRGIGFGIPYSVQFTNPERYEYQGATLPQADPSGLFKPDGLSATWYMMIDEETGESYVEYFEPEIIVKQQKAPRRLCAEWSLPDSY